MRRWPHQWRDKNSTSGAKNWPTTRTGQYKQALYIPLTLKIALIPRRLMCCFGWRELAHWLVCPNPYSAAMIFLGKSYSLSSRTKNMNNETCKISTQLDQKSVYLQVFIIHRFAIELEYLKIYFLWLQITKVENVMLYSVVSYKFVWPTWGWSSWIKLVK